MNHIEDTRTVTRRQSKRAGALPRKTDTSQTEKNLNEVSKNLNSQLHQVSLI